LPGQLSRPPDESSGAFSFVENVTGCISLNEIHKTGRTLLLAKDPRFLRVSERVDLSQLSTIRAK